YVAVRRTSVKFKVWPCALLTFVYAHEFVVHTRYVRIRVNNEVAASPEAIHKRTLKVGKNVSIIEEPGIGFSDSKIGRNGDRARLSAVRYNYLKHLIFYRENLCNNTTCISDDNRLIEIVAIKRSHLPCTCILAFHSCNYRLTYID